MAPHYQEVVAASWTEAVACLNSLDPHCIFRGQSDASWELRTSIERCVFFTKNYRVEKDFLCDFQRPAHSYGVQLPRTEDTLSWLALMQHHGAPTRLLDFTESPYIAAFFALEGAEKPSAVWAVHRLHLLEDLANKSPESFQYRGDEFYGLPDEAFNRIFEENKLPCVFPVQPSVATKRYVAQQGIFVSMGNTNSTFMDQLMAYSWPEYLHEHIWKVVLSEELRDEALYDLSRMNINRATLFPDLDGFATHLRSIYELRYRGAAWAVRNRSSTEPRPVPDTREA